MNQLPPSPWVSHLGHFNYFFLFTEIFRSSRCTPVSLTLVANGKKSSIRKVLTILYGHLWVVELTHKYIFFFIFTLRFKQSDFVPIIWHRYINNTSGTGGKFNVVLLDTGVVDTSWKFAAIVVDSGGKFLVHLVLRISLQILEKKS